MKLLDILMERANPQTYDLSGMQQELGVVWKNVDYTFTHEEIEAIKSSGKEVPRIGMKFRSGTHEIPIIYSHTLQQAGNEGLMHAVKMRHDDHKMQDGAIEQMINDSVNLIFGNKKLIAKDRMHGTDAKQRAIDIIRMGANKHKPLVVPMPSSSPLTMMFAEAVAKKIGSTVSNVLIKHPFPEKSKMIRTVSRGFEPAQEDSPSPADRVRAAQRQIQKNARELKQLYANEDVTDEIIERIDDLERQQTELAASIDVANNKWGKKSLQSAGGNSRRYYDYIRHNGEVSQMHDRHIILIDDNVVTGETIAEAIKSFVRNGIVPHVLGGICIHQYQ